MSLTGLKSLNDSGGSIMEPFIDEPVLVRSEPLSLASPKSETLTANAPSSYVCMSTFPVAEVAVAHAALVQEVHRVQEPHRHLAADPKGHLRS